MLLLIALHGCGEDNVRTIEVVPPRAPAVASELRIATLPDRAGVVRASVLSSALPGGELVVRDCYGGVAEERKGGPMGGRPGVSGGGGSTRFGGGPPPPTKRPAPAPAPSPRPMATPRPRGDSAGKDISSGEGRRAAQEPVVFDRSEGQPPPASPAAEEAPMDQPVAAAPPASTSRPLSDADGADDGGDASPERAKPTETAQTIVTSSPAHGAEDLRTTTDVTRRPNKPEPKVAPVVDWGATVYLSNDDSMSLASAQRVLYALKRGLPIRPSEVRPHELLNYFSFDSVPPTEDTTFGVLGAAEQDGDTLTVSLAVRGANPARQALDLSIVVDLSCSMHAEDRMGYTKRGLSLLSDNLQKGDRIDLVLFDSGSCTPLENYVVGRDDPSLLREAIRRIQPTSATNIDAGMQEAWRIQTGRDAASVHQRSRRVLLVTDALLNSGMTDPARLASEAGEMLAKHRIGLSGVGVGLEFDDKVLDQLTEQGKGAYVYLGSEAVVDRVFGPGFDSLVRTIAHDVHFSLDLPDSLAMEKFYGEEASTDKADVQPIHYFAGTTQLFLQDLKIRDATPVLDDRLTMRIEYRDATTGEPQTQELQTTVGALLEGDPHNLRKGKALAAFGDVVMARAMHADPCGAPLATYRERASLLADDAEIGFVNSLVGQTCRVDLTTVVARGVELKVKVDSDQVIPEVALECGGRQHLEKLSGGDTVARFSAVTPGTCRVRLEGVTPMTAEVAVPETGGDLRCVVRGGRVSCS